MSNIEPAVSSKLILKTFSNYFGGSEGDFARNANGYRNYTRDYIRSTSNRLVLQHFEQASNELKHSSKAILYILTNWLISKKF